MQSDDGHHEKCGRYIDRMGAWLESRLTQRDCGDPRGNQHRGEQVASIPFDKTFDMIGCHARVVHEGNAQTDDGAAKLRRELRIVERAKPEAQSTSNDGNEQGDHGQDRIEHDRSRHLVGQHGDEMRAPDRRPRGNRRQDAPTVHLNTRANAGPGKKSECNPRSSNTDNGRKSHEPKVVLGEKARDDAHS